MNFRAVYLILFLFSISISVSQNENSVFDQLKKTDEIQDDSLALVSLEKIDQEKLAPKLKMEMGHRLIQRFANLRKFEKAVSLGNEYLTLALKSGSDTMVAVFNKQLGTLNYYMDRKRVAVGYYEKALSLSQKSAYLELEASCNHRMGEAMADLFKYDSAVLYLLRSHQIMKQLGKENTGAALRTLRVLARTYSESGKKDEAENLYITLIEKSLAIKDSVLWCDNLLYYSTILAERQQFERAIAMSAQAVAYRRRHNDPHELQWAMQLHGHNLSKGDRFKEAYDLMVEHTYLKRRIFKNDLEKEISEVEVKYKTAQIQYEKELAELKTKKQRQVYLFSFLAILVFGISGIFIWNQRKNAKINLRLQAQKLETLIEGEEKERIRVAKDLHDGIVQDLTALKLNLNDKLKNSDVKVTQEFNSISADIDKAIKEVRGISYQLMPQALDKYGLIPALEDLLQKLMATTNIAFEFNAIDATSESGSPDKGERFPEKIELCIYRVSQELLNNIIKHSEASFVSMTLSRQKNKLTLICEDNGKGFDETTIKKGIGMNSISSRVELLNGTVSFQAAYNEGTTVHISIPLNTIP